MCDSDVLISDEEEGVQNDLCQQSETEDIQLLPLRPTLQAALPAPSTSHGYGDTPAHIHVMEAVARTPGTGAADDELEPMDIKIERPSHRPSDAEDLRASHTQAIVQAVYVALESLDNNAAAIVKTLVVDSGPLNTNRNKGTNALSKCMFLYFGRIRYSMWLAINRQRKADREAERKVAQIQLRPLELEKIIIKAMVAAANDLNILNCPSENGQTPLYDAIKQLYSYDIAIEALVNAGAHLSNLNDLNDSVLHVAVQTGSYSVLKYFLDNPKILSSNNKQGEAPIHAAVRTGHVHLLKLLLDKFGTDQLGLRTNQRSTVWHLIAGCNSYDIAEYLFKTGTTFVSKWRLALDLNKADDIGTPLDRAISGGYERMTALLLRKGATLAAKEEKYKAIKEIADRFNNPSNFFEDVFDKFINESNNQIYVDYTALVSKDLSQIKVLEDFMRFGLNRILKHPTIESLIYFKWRCLLPVFYTIIVTYMTFLMSLNIFVITTFYTIDTSNVTCGGIQVTFNAADTPLNAAETSCVGSCGWRHWILVVLIYISTGVLITQECVWIYLQKLHHFGRPETWLKLVVLVLALAVPVFLGCSPAPDSMTWQRHVACVAVLLSWVQGMLLMSRLHGWGYYVLMLERVAINILKIFAMTIFLVIGFSTCLMIQYQSQPPFDGPVAAFTKTLVMMASEFDYEVLFGEHHDAELKYTKTLVQCIFVLFVIFIAIVLINFMIGVAVSDVKELNDVGNIRRLEMQVQLLSTLEGLGDTVLSEWWPKLRLIRFHRRMDKFLEVPARLWHVHANCTSFHGILEHEKHRCFTETLSSELHISILKIVQKMKQNVDKSTPTTLNEKINSMEDALRELTKSVDQALEMSASTRSTAHGCKISSSIVKSIADTNSEMKQSIDSLREDVKILTFVALGTAQTNKRRVLSSKVVSRRRKVPRRRDI